MMRVKVVLGAIVLGILSGASVGLALPDLRDGGGWIIDPDNQVAESNENNNVAYATVYAMILTGGSEDNGGCDNGQGDTCLQPGSRVVLLDKLTEVSTVARPLPGHGGTVLCKDSVGRLLVSWDLWQDKDQNDANNACVDPVIGSYPEGSAFWIARDYVACDFNECGILRYDSTDGGLYFDPNDGNPVRVSPLVGMGSLAGAITRGDKLRLRGLYSPEGNSIRRILEGFVGYTGPCVFHPIVSACDSSAPTTCCETLHITLGQRVVYQPGMLSSPVVPPIGTSGTVLCCSAAGVLVTWDLTTFQTTVNTSACTATLPSYVPSNSMSWVQCGELLKPVDLCGTVERPSPNSYCASYNFRPDDTTYGLIPLYDSLSTWQTGDRIEIRALLGYNLSDIVIPSCSRPTVLLFDPIISSGCKGCLPDLTVSPMACGFTPDTLNPPQDLTVQLGLKNQGCKASGPFSVRVYASTDMKISTSDYQLCEWSMSSMNPGESGMWKDDVPIHSGDLPDGTYFIGLVIDPGNEIPESNECNNTYLMPGALCMASCDLSVTGVRIRTGTYTPGPPPDNGQLIPGSIVQDVHVGDCFWIELQVYNSGSAPVSSMNPLNWSLVSGPASFIQVMWIGCVYPTTLPVGTSNWLTPCEHGEAYQANGPGEVVISITVPMTCIQDYQYSFQILP